MGLTVALGVIVEDPDVGLVRWLSTARPGADGVWTAIVDTVMWAVHGGLAGPGGLVLWGTVAGLAGSLVSSSPR